MHLNKKLPFGLDLNELGFPKLKDLIMSESDRITLELRGTNHPFAYLKSLQKHQPPQTTTFSEFSEDLSDQGQQYIDNQVNTMM